MQHHSPNGTSPRLGDTATNSPFGIYSDGKFVGANTPEPFVGSSQSERHDSLVSVEPKDLLDMAPWKTVDFISPGLYLGNLSTAKSTRYLTEHRITHIVSVCTDSVPAQWPESGFHHLRIPIQDYENEDLLRYMRPACEFIEAALANRGNVLVHSELGKSRSAAIVAAYIMRKYRIGAGEACAIVRDAREQAWVNRGFQEQLVIFQIDQYAPDPNKGAYLGWLIKVASANHTRHHRK